MLKQRGGRLTAAMVALCTVVAVVAGLLIAFNGSDHSPETAAQRTRNAAPFEQALAALATARGLRYQDTAIAGITARDITVTPSGALLGSTGDGVQDLDKDVLKVGGKTYTRWKKARPGEEPEDPSKPDGQQDSDAPGTWTIGDPGESQSLDPVLAQFLPPAELAGELWDALDRVKTLPDANDPDLASVNVRGVPALRVDTPAGRLLVSRNKPYRVLRLEPYDLADQLHDQVNNQLHDQLQDQLQDQLTQSRMAGSPSVPPQVTTGPLKDGDSQGMDLSPVSGDQADRMYGALEADTKKLADAVDHGIDFTLDTADGNLNCSAGGCSVSQKFTGQLTTDARTRLVGGSVTADMSATVTIDGQDAGGCSSAQSTFPITGSTVSGTLSCSDPGAGAVFTSVDAKYKAQAEAESRASGGQVVPYRFPYAAHAVVNAAAVAVGEVDKLVKQVQRERSDGECPTSQNSGTDASARHTESRSVEQPALNSFAQTAGQAPDRLVTGSNASLRSHTYSVPAGSTSDPAHCEVFYRMMSEKEYKQLGPKGEITVKGTDNFVTQSRPYLLGLRNQVQSRGGRNAEKYTVLVRYEMSSDVLDALIAAGKRPNEIGHDLNAIHLKIERGAETFGLRPGSVDIFNSRITGFQRVADW